ncbi:hypothetical protein YB2330_003897 [Saitoella coloradoensis]
MFHSVIRQSPRAALFAAQRTFASSQFAMAQSALYKAIQHDHVELAEYYNNYKKMSSAFRPDEAQKWANQFIWELARHAIGEELVVYPAFEKHLGAQGKEMADRDRQQHLGIKQELYDLQNMSTDSPAFEDKFTTLWGKLDLHVKEEEKDDLPKLDAAISAEDAESYATSFQRTKHFVPTRSHPSAPDKPPFETIAGLLAAPIDKLGDLFRSFPK